MADRTIVSQRRHDTREELGSPVDKSDAGNYHRESLKGTPVIPRTSLSDQQDVIKGVECGADGFVVEAYGGTISIESESAQEVPEELIDEAPTRGTETILVVEDEEMIRPIIFAALVESGYSVLLAKDGEEAWKISESTQGPIHLLLSDVVLPGTSGRESANAIVHHGMLEPGIAFLQKPFGPAALLRKVREILDSENAPAVQEALNELP